MTQNPYKPPTLNIDGRSTWSRLLDAEFYAIPVRVGPVSPIRWVGDALVAFLLWSVGTLAASAMQSAPLMASVDYTVCLTLGWFPIALWMHYCGVVRMIGCAAATLAALALAFASSPVSEDSTTTALLSFAALTLLLPLEFTIGRFVLGALPSSSARYRETEL